MTDIPEEDPQNRNHTSNQLRTNQIKTKKNSLPHDREYLYAENLDLKNKIKELTQINIKIKTQLSITEKQKINLCNIAQEEAFRVKLPQRSQSGNHKKVATNLQSFNINPQGPMTLQKQKQNAALKKLIREQTIEIEKLNNEIQRLKKTMKFTRMNELQTENLQLLEETHRLKSIIAEKKENEKITFVSLVQEIESLKDKLKKEKDSEKRNGFDLKKQLDINNELKERLSDLQTKKVEAEKRVVRENKLLKNQLSDIRSKLYQQTVVRNKQCDREGCIRTLKQKNELKKKNESHLREITKLKEELSSVKRQCVRKDLENRKTQHQKSFTKTPDKQQKSLTNSHIKKVEGQSSIIKNESSGRKVQSNKKQSSKVEETKKVQKVDVDREPQKEKQVNKIQEPEVESVALEPKMETSEKIQVKSREDTGTQKLRDNLFKEPKDPRIQKSKKTEKSLPSDSMNTEKLLQSVQGDLHPELVLQSATKEKDEKQKLVEKEKSEPLDPKLIESDGEYEALNFEEFEKGEPNPKPKQKEKESEEGKKKKKKDKSKKKLTEDEELLYEEKAKEVDNSDKAELKLIKETLIYKFMAQNYSYDNFTKDLKSNKSIKEFTIQQIFQLLGAEPFLLEQDQVQTVLIYLFGTEKLTGQEVLSVKDFIKKMKKFIGNTINYEEAQLSQIIEALSKIIEKGSTKLKNKFKEHDQGDGTVTLEDFSAVMTSAKVKDQVLKMAIAQITYGSRDLNHLNFDVFLKRFLEEGK